MSSAPPRLPDDSAPLVAPPAAHPEPRAAAQIRYGLVITLTIALGIALLLTALDGSGFLTKLTYSLAVSLCCWLVLDGGRLALSHWLTRRGRQLDPGAAPVRLGRRYLLPLAAIAAFVGPAAGLALGDWVTGLRSPGLGDWDSPALRLTFAFALAGTAIALTVGALVDRLASSRVQAQIARREAAEYELKLLQAQLEPHMLFNTLANLRILIHTDPQAAQQMLDRLIAFLRAMLAGSRAHVHTLAQEFARLDDYLALMRVRMGQRLQVTLDLPPALREASVPPLLLQPLVENAIRHGLEPHVGPGRIAVCAVRDETSLRLTVRDTGAGLPATFSPGGTHFGLEHVRRRLRTLYGEAASFTIAPATDHDGGTLATITLPLKDLPR